MLEQVAISSSGGLPDPGIEPAARALQMGSLPLSRWGSPDTWQSPLRLRDPGCATTASRSCFQSFWV